MISKTDSGVPSSVINTVKLYVRLILDGPRDLAFGLEGVDAVFPSLTETQAK
jgi:hypothetical protein